MASVSKAKAMKSASLADYFVMKVVLPAAVGNVGLGFLFGALTFPAGRLVPILGAVSACGDTLVSSFFMGFITMILVAPTSAMEARGGRVRGFGLGARWLLWARKHRIGSAFVLGVLWLVLFGFPAVRWLQAGGETLPRATFLAFKAGFAGVFGILAAIVAAVVGLAPEADLRRDPRWCRDPEVSVRGVVYPLEYMDKAALAVTSRERGTSGTPTWELRVNGTLHPEDVKTALADLATRYPSIATKVQALDGAPPVARSYRYAHDARFHVDAIFDVIEARDPHGIAALTRERRSRHLDPFTDFPLTLTMVITGDESCLLVFRQHHAIADGRAFIGLLVDFAAFLNDARARWRPSEKALAPIGRRGELEGLGLTQAQRRSHAIAGVGILARGAMRALASPLTPLLQNRSNDYSGENATIHWSLPDAALGPWDAARKRLGVSLNTLLTGALMLANQRVHRAKGLPLGRTNAQLLMETRPRATEGAPFLSFANHLTFLEAEADLGKATDPAALVQSIQAQVTAQREQATPIKRLLGERFFVGLLPLEQVQRIIFESSRPQYNLNFSNLIALEFPMLEGEGWRVEDVLITTPVAPRHGIVLTVIRYGGRLVFNFNYKSTAATRELTEEIRTQFEAVMAEMTAAPPPS
jgi:hypothetical protein